MANSAETLQQIEKAKQMAVQLSQTQPNGAPWAALLALLEFYEVKVQDHWPLTAEEKENSKLGWFSVKNIEEPYPQLHRLVSNAAFSIRHSGEEDSRKSAS